MVKMIEFIRNHPARLYAVVVAVLALVADFGLTLPADGILGVAAAMLALVTGETVQRVENTKTRQGK